MDGALAEDTAPEVRAVARVLQGQDEQGSTRGGPDPIAGYQGAQDSAPGLLLHPAECAPAPLSLTTHSHCLCCNTRPILVAKPCKPSARFFANPANPCDRSLQTLQTLTAAAAEGLGVGVDGGGESPEGEERLPCLCGGGPPAEVIIANRLICSVRIQIKGTIVFRQQ